MNNVLLAGKVLKFTQIEGRDNNEVYDVLVEVKQIGPNETVNVSTYAVFMLGSNAQSLKNAMQLNEKANKPLYVTLKGELRERRLNPEDKENQDSQIYIYARQLLAVSSLIEAYCADFSLGGIVKYMKGDTSKKTQKDYTRVLLKNVTKISKEKNAYVGLWSTLFKSIGEVDFVEGQYVVASGRLESGEHRKAPGVYTISAVVFDYYPVLANNSVEKAPEAEKDDSVDAKLTDNLPTNLNIDLESTGNDEGLPF